ncbi:MAG: hypothetical protein ACTHK0_14320 [Ginsengibacter sp.]
MSFKILLFTLRFPMLWASLSNKEERHNQFTLKVKKELQSVAFFGKYELVLFVRLSNYTGHSRF